MDPQIEQWQRQAQEALRSNPDAKDAIEAEFNKLVNTLPQKWQEQATEAIKAGGNVNEIEQHLGKLFSDVGIIPKDPLLALNPTKDSMFSPLDERVDNSPALRIANNDMRPEQFANVTGGGPTPEMLQEAEQKRVDKERDEMSLWDAVKVDAGAAGRMLGGGLMDTARGAVGLGAAAIPALVTDPGVAQSMQDQAFSASDYLGEKADEIRGGMDEHASTAAKVVGALPPLFFGGFLTEQFNRGADVLQEGPTKEDIEYGKLNDMTPDEAQLLRAQAESGKQAAINLGGVATGMMGSQAAGKAAMASRAALQVPANVLLGEADRYSRGEESTTGDRVMDAALGGLFSGFRNPPAAKAALENPPPPPEKFVPEIDVAPMSGAALKADHALRSTPIDVTQQYSQKFNNPERNLDFGSQPETTVNVGELNTGPKPATSLVDQIENIDKTVPFELPPQQGGADVTVLPPREEFSVKSPDPLEGDVSATVSPAPLDKSVKSPVSTFKYNLDENGVPRETLTQKTKKKEALHDLDSLKKLANAEEELASVWTDTLNGAGDVQAKNSILPESVALRLKPGTTMAVEVAKALDKGELTVGRLLDATINNESQMFTNAPAVREWAKFLKAMAGKFGGLEQKILIPDTSTPEGLAAAARVKKAGGRWEPGENRVYLGEEFDNNTLHHEAGHAILGRVIERGQRALKAKAEGKPHDLTANELDAFEKLTTIMDMAKREGEPVSKKYEQDLLAKGHTPEEAAFLTKRHQTYGFQDLHEMFSEMGSNPQFRKHLQSIKITDDVAKKLGLGRSALGKVRNLYQAVLAKAKQMLGLDTKTMGISDKGVENALDALFSSGQRFFDAVPEGNSSVIKAQNAPRAKDRAATPFPEDAEVEHIDMSSSPRDDLSGASAKEKLQPARNKYLAGAKGLWAGRGVEPLVTKAKEFLSGSKKAARQEDIANTNKATSILSKVGPETRTKIRELQQVIHDDMSTPAAGKALAELRELNPEMAALTQKLALDSRNNSLDLMREAIRSQEGQPTPDPKVLAMAAKYYENRNKYSPVIYDSAEATARRTKSAKRAEKKLADGKLLSKEEQQDLQAWNNLKSWIKDTTFGDVATLSKETYPSIRTIFDSKFGTGALKDKGYDQLPKEARKQAMIEDIAQENSQIKDIDKAINNMADSIAGLDQGNGKVLDYFNGLKYSKDVFKSLTQVPEPIRKYWGEVSDPLLKMVEANTRQKLQLAEIKGLNELREQGMGTLFTDRKDTDMNAVLDGPGYGALQGLRTTPDIKKALGDIKDFNGQAVGVIDSILSGRDLNTTTLGMANKALLRWTQLTRAVKTNVTIGNLGAWWRNAEGSVLQAMSNGNSDANTYKQGLRAMKGLVGISGKTEVNPDSLLMAKLDLAEASQTTDTYSPRNKKAKDELRRLLDEHPEADTPGKIRKVMDAGGYGVDVAKEMYGALDLWTKFANFYNDRNKWKAFNERNSIKMSDEQLDRFVADRTKQTNISYSRSPKALKIADALGGTQFANYYWEVFRTSLNNVHTGISDIRTAAKYGDWQMFQHGADRLAGTSMAVYGGTQLYTSIMKGTAAMLGFTAAAEGDDEAVREYRKDTSFFDPESTVDFKDPETGAVYGFDTSMISPYDPATKVLIPALKAMQDPKNAEKYLKEMGENAVDLFNRTPLIAQAGKVLRGATTSLAKSDPETYSWLQEVGISDAGLTPKTVDRLINTAQPFVPKTVREGLRGANTEGEGRTKKAVASGIGVYELNPLKDVTNYLGNSFRYELREAKDNYKSLATSSIPMTEGRLEKSFTSAMKDIAKPYGKLEKALAAHEAMGKDRKEILKVINEKTGDKDVAKMLASGKAYPARIVYDDLREVAKEEIGKLSGDKKEAAKERWNTKLKALRDIVRKYKDTTFEELE